MSRENESCSNDMKLMLAEIEEKSREWIQNQWGDEYCGLEGMFIYQMGWSEKTRGSGKRIRPILTLLTVDGLGGEWRKAIPAAMALELLHNYSLIHDDIEDNSTLRRGQETIWVKWGQAQGINSGDAMLNLALSTPWLLEKDYPLSITVDVVKTLQQYSIELTKGQFLDISFENRSDVSISEYFEMVEGKTCSLFKAALEIGAILGWASMEDRQELRDCGSLLGRAYQIQDDWLGIWGDESITGKSNQSDLLERKKTFPVISGLDNNQHFAYLWSQPEKKDGSSMVEMARLLEEEGIKKTCENEFNRVYQLTFAKLEVLRSKSDKMTGLMKFLRSLLKRQF